MEETKQRATVIGNNNNISQNIINIYLGDRIIELIHDNSSPRKRLQIQSSVPYKGTRIPIITQCCSSTVRWIEGIQKDDWSIPSDNESGDSCAWVTSGLLYSCYAFTGKMPRWWKSGLQWALSQLADDGGIPFGNKKNSDFAVTDATALTLLCILELDSNDKAVNKLVQWLVNAQHKNGGFPWCILSEKENVVSTGYALLALRLYSVKSKSNNSQVFDAMKFGIQWLMETRNHDGGWGSQADDKSRPANTGFITYVLNTFSLQNLCDESRLFLINSYDEKAGGWIDSIDRPLPHNVTRLGLPYTLLGLSCLTPSDDVSAYIEKGVELILNNYTNGVYSPPITSANTWPTRDVMLAFLSIIDK